MASQQSRFSIANLFVPTIVLSIVGVYGYLAFRPALVTQRPEDNRSREGDTRESTGAILEAEARFWEDPLGPKYSAAKASATGGASPPSTQGLLQRLLKYSAAKNPAIEGASPTPTRGLLRGLLPSLYDDPNDSRKKKEVLVMPVYVPGDQDANSRDQRLRTRYAIISALTTGGYRAQARNKLQFLRVRSGSGSSAFVVPFELFVLDIVDRFYDEDEFGRFRAVLVCWLDESSIGQRPLEAARELSSELGINSTCNAVSHTLRMLGPSTSDVLLSMASEAAKMDKSGKTMCPDANASKVSTEAANANSDIAKSDNAKPGSKTPEGGESDNGNTTGDPQATDGTASETTENPTRIFAQLFSPRATLPTNRLKSKPNELTVNYNVEDLLEGFVRPPASATPKDGSDTNSVSDKKQTFKDLASRIGLEVSRTIGNDEQLVKALKAELSLRSSWPHDCNWPYEYDPHECIVLLTERDSLYGRMMPKLFSRELAQDWNFVETHIQQAGKANLRDFVIQDEGLDREDIYVRVALDRRGFIKDGQLLIGTQPAKDNQHDVQRLNIKKSWNFDGYRLGQESSDDDGSAIHERDFLGTWEINIQTGANSSYTAKFAIKEQKRPDETKGDGSQTESTLVATWKLPAPLVVYKYLSGIDGRLTEKELAAEAQTGNNKLPSDLAAGYEPAGTSQLDYLRRMENELAELHAAQLRNGGRGILSIGIVGSDVFDKLILLRALVQRFPNARFFTTDLDANYSRPSEIAYTTNLIVATHYGLELHPSLQRGVPPFRHGYQTAMFFTALLAMDDPRAKNVLGERKPAYLWYEPPKAANGDNPDEDEDRDEDVSLRPLIFEISNSGPYQLTRTMQNWAEHMSPVASIHPRRPGTPLTTVVQPPSPRDVNNWPFNRALVVIVLVSAVLSIVAIYITAVRRTLLVFLDSLIRIAHVLYRVCVELGLGIGRAFGFFADLPRHPPRLPSARDLAIVLAVLFVLGLIGVIGWDHSRADGEPFELVLGISVWPSTLIRLAAAIASVTCIWHGIVQLDMEDRQLVGRLLPKAAEPNSANPLDWSPRDCFNLRKAPLAKPTKWNLSKRLRFIRLYLRDLPRVLNRLRLNNWQPPDDRIETVVAHFVRKGRPWSRLLRTGIMLLLSVILVISLFAFTYEPLASPHRGWVALEIGYSIWLACALSLSALAFFVVDATRYCQRLVEVFQDKRIQWPNDGDGSSIAPSGGQTNPDVFDLKSIELIAVQSKMAGKLLYYPFSVLLLVLIARLQTFDNWSIPAPMIVIFLLLLLTLIAHSLVLRREAAKTKENVLLRLERSRIEMSQIKKADRDLREVQLSVITREVQQERRGAFRALSEDDLVKALTIPFGGAGGLLLLEQILT